MIALEPAGCYFHFVNDEMLNESMFIDQLHVANNIYYIVDEEYKLNGSKIKSLIFYHHLNLNAHSLNVDKKNPITTKVRLDDQQKPRLKVNKFFY